MHWWLAHAMPDLRGSAAKTELGMRAVAAAHGMDLPPFRRGVIPDLEAFVTQRNAFSEGYPALFEGVVPEIPAADMSQSAKRGCAKESLGTAEPPRPKEGYRPALETIVEDAGQRGA
jgi:hypothetical protein